MINDSNVSFLVTVRNVEKGRIKLELSCRQEVTFSPSKNQEEFLDEPLNPLKASLVFLTKEQPSIALTSNISIWFVEIRSDRARLGIHAPKKVAVYRKEVFDAIHEER